jgi:hypothetical protein
MTKQKKNKSTLATSLQTYDELSNANKKIVYRELLKRFRHMDIPLPKAKALVEMFFPHIKFTSWRNDNRYVVPTLVIGKIERYKDSAMLKKGKRK